MACRCTGDDVPASVSVAMGLALHLEKWAEQAQETMGQLPIMALMGSATHILTRIADFQETSELWDNVHRREYDFALAVGLASSLWKQSGEVIESEQAHRRASIS